MRKPTFFNIHDGLGRLLYHLYHHVFDHDLDTMLRVLLDEHTAGWSFLGTDWSHPIGYTSLGLGDGPQCYCHGERHDAALELTEQNAADANCVYAYVLTRQADGQAVMRILRAAWERPDGSATWIPLADVLLEKKAPSWKSLDNK